MPNIGAFNLVDTAVQRVKDVRFESVDQNNFNYSLKYFHDVTENKTETFCAIIKQAVSTIIKIKDLEHTSLYQRYFLHSDSAVEQIKLDDNQTAIEENNVDSMASKLFPKKSTTENLSYIVPEQDISTVKNINWEGGQIVGEDIEEEDIEEEDIEKEDIEEEDIEKEDIEEEDIEKEETDSNTDNDIQNDENDKNSHLNLI